jgi:plastocyanin
MRIISATSRLHMALLGSLTLVLVAGAPAVQTAQADVGTNSNNDVSIAAFAFSPAEVSVPVGTVLTWTNAQDGVQHTTTSPEGVWDSGVLSTNDSFGFTFEQPGDFAYQCTIHPSMRGVVHVVAGPNVQSATSTTAGLPTPPTLSTAIPAQTTSTSVAQAPAASPTPLPTVKPASSYGY